jgi:hypothetical protein
MPNNGPDDLIQAVSNLWAYLQTWLDEKGGVHGYVVYHNRDNMKFLSPDPWSQAPCILGLSNIYEKTREEKWLKLALKLSNYLVDMYIPSIHVYRNSNADRKPLGVPALEANALASYTLLEMVRKYKRKIPNWEIFYQIARDNIHNYILKQWDSQNKAFVSIYHGRFAHIHNKNCLTILALNALSDVENDESYVEKYSRNAANFVVNCQVREGAFSGAYPYADRDKNYRTNYTLTNVICLLFLYRRTKDPQLLESAYSGIKSVIPYIDYETGLICHLHRRGFPQYILDTSLLLFAIYFMKNEFDVEIISSSNVAMLLHKVLAKQYKNGAFPYSIGFEDLWYKKEIPSKPWLKRWRDLLPVPAINAQIFWMLSGLLPDGTHMKDPVIDFTLKLRSDPEESEGPYWIIDDVDKVTFMSIDEKEFLAIFNKKSEVADLCLLRERGDYWGTLASLAKYPEFLRRFILTLPYFLSRK